MIRLLDVVAVWGVRLAAVLVAPLLLVFARTWRGRAVGVIAASWWGFILCVVTLIYTEQYVILFTPPSGYVPPIPPFGIPLWAMRGAFQFASYLLPLLFLWSCLAVAFLFLTMPAYDSDDLAHSMRSVFLERNLFRWQMAVFDEQDWLCLGVRLCTRFDPRIGRAEARDIRERVGTLLDEMREMPDYRDVPPALPLVFWGRVFRPDHGHLFVYRPTCEPGERLGLLVFLHGHGGNTLLLPHLLRDFAAEHRLVLVCPSFGYGNWEHPDSPAAVQRAVNYVLEHFTEIDPARVYLAGLSQGGAGVGRAAVALPDTFAGLVFLSGTMEPKVLNSEAFAGRRVLVIQGDRDRHVTLKRVLTGVEALKQVGADVTVLRDPTGTHSLLFIRTADVLAQVGEWFMSR